MTKHLNTAIFLLLFLALFLACKKNPAAFGTNVQPESDGVNSTWSDELALYMHTVKYDSSRSYPDQFKYLGSNQDPLFGRTDASIFTNLSITDNVSNVTFGDDAVLDSCQMILAFTQSFVGDTTTTLTFNVHQLTQSMPIDTRYFMHNSATTATSTIAYNSTPICSAKARMSLTSDVHTFKLPINYNFAQSILINPQYLVNNAVFQSAYKGFYITTKTSNLNPGMGSQGALMKIDLDNSISGLYLYYHNGSVSSAKESKKYRFSFSGTDAVRFNKVEYNYATTGPTPLLFNQLVMNDSMAGQQDIFLKGLGGTRALIRIPDLKNLSDSFHVAVNRAEMIFKVDQSFKSFFGTYDAPPLISLEALDSAGRESFIYDQFSDLDLVRFGGQYDSTLKQYVFNIARHVQGILDGKIKNYGFYLVVADPDKTQTARRDIRAERVVLGGPLNAQYRPRFNLTYVKFPYDK